MNKFKIIIVLIFIFSVCTSYSYADENYVRINKDSNIQRELDLNNDGIIDAWVTVDVNKKAEIKDTSKIVLQKGATNFNEFFECTVIDLNNDGIKELVIITLNKDKSMMYGKTYTYSKSGLVLKSELSGKLTNETINTSYIVSSDINKNSLKEMIIVYRDNKSNLINRWDAYEFVGGKLSKILSEALKGQSIIQIKIDDAGKIIKKKIIYGVESLVPKEYINMYYEYRSSKLVYIKQDANKKYYTDIPDKTLDSIFKKVGIEEGVPYEVLKGIAMIESKNKQFDYGEPLLSFDNGIGIMQITPISSNQKINYLTGEDANIDITRLYIDTEYNIRIGARILQEKWRMAFGGIIPKISDMNPEVLENWYFSIMAYNGYVTQNMPKNIWGNAYQEKVIDRIPGFHKANFSYSKMLAHGLNDKGIPILDEYKLEDGIKSTENVSSEIKAGEYLKAFVECSLRSAPEITNNVIGKINKGTKVQILEKTGVGNGYIWYKVKTEDGREGYAVGMFFRYYFDDIAALSWGKSEIINIEQLGIIDSNEEVSFRPTDNMTRGEFCKYIVKTLKLELKGYNGIFPDILVNNPNALYIEAANAAGIINGIPLNDKVIFDENGKITREQIAAILMRIYKNGYLNITAAPTGFTFSDLKTVGDWAVEDVKSIASLGIMQGNDGKFMPKANTTRQEAASLIYRLHNILKGA